MVCLYCGCGGSGAEPACFQPASGSYRTWSSMPGLKLVTNLICTPLALWAFFVRVQNALIVCCLVFVRDHSQTQYRTSLWRTEVAGEKRENADVWGDQAMKATAITQDHQDKLCSHNMSLLLAECALCLLLHGHNLKPKLLAWPKWQNHAPLML